MPLNRYVVRVDPQGQTVTVDVRDTSGVSAAVFESSQFDAPARTLPLVITSQTEFWLRSPGPYDVSCLVGGAEVAAAGVPKRVQVSDVPVLVVPDWERQRTAAASGGGSVPTPTAPDAGKALVVNAAGDGFALASGATLIKGYVSWAADTGQSNPTFQPFGFVPGGGSKGAGVTGFVYLAPGEAIQVYPLLIDPATPLVLPYAELFVVSVDGTERLGIEADSGLTLNDGQFADWTGYSDFGAAGTDLASQNDDTHKGIVTTGGGLFHVSLALWQSS